MWNLSKFDRNVALQDEHGVSLTYSDLNKFSDEIAGVMSGRCLVFCLCTNSIGSIVGYVGCMNHRIIPVMLNAHLETELLEELIMRYEPNYIWMPAECNISCVNGKGYKYEAWSYKLIQYSNIQHVLGQDLGLLLTTSGSTGSPKFVRQSYENVKYNAEQIIEYLKLAEDEKAITTLPMNYTYGLSIINSHLLAGAAILVTEKSLLQKEFWQFFRSQQATSFGGVPYTYEILEKLRFFRMDLPSLRYMTQAGGKLSLDLHKKFAEYAMKNNKKFIVMYGQCEATARMGYLPAEQALTKCGSMGIAIPGGKFRLIDEKGNEISESYVVGELVYEGKNVTLGYAECKEDLSKGNERDGVLYTGDMAQFDEDGYFYIVGRKKRFLKIYGNRVNLDEIDRLIKDEFGTFENVCAGVDDHMYIFVTDPSVKDRVHKFIAGKTGLNPIAFKVIAIEDIPRSDSGKVLYKQLEKYYD